jgi:MFS transporter, DHA1 family, multidrug resistance protein
MNRKAFIVLVASMFISMLGLGIVSPFLPIYASNLGASTMQVGLVQAGFSITGIGTLLFIGRLSDRFGRKSFLIGGLSILAVSSLGLMHSTSPIQLIVWRFIQGLGASAHMPIAQAYLGDIAPRGSEGRWMGYFNAVLFAGMGAGPLLGGVITDAFNIQATFLFMAILTTLGLLATIIFLKEMPRKKAGMENVSYLAPLKSRSMRGVLSYNMTSGIGIACLMAFMPLYADQRLGLSASLIGILLAARSPVAILQSYTGRLADRWNRRSMVLYGSILSIVAIAVLPLTGGFWLLLTAYLLVAFGQTLGMPAANAYVVQEGRHYGMGAAMTMFMMSMNIGMGLGPVVLGRIADYIGLNSVFYLSAAGMTIGIIAFARLIPRSSGKETVADLYPSPLEPPSQGR